jgi:hypothetical protein
MLTQFAARDGNHEVAGRVNVQFLRAVDDELHVVGIAPGGDNEIIFKVALVAVVNDVDGRVNVAGPYPGELLNSSPPRSWVFSEKVVAASCEWFFGLHVR